MFDFHEDGTRIIEVPIPESIKETGTIPEEYAVDYLLDPSTVIATLAKNGMTTMEQIPDDLFVKIKEEINAAVNVTIAPWIAVEKRRQMTEDIFKTEAAQAEKSEETP